MVADASLGPQGGLVITYRIVQAAGMTAETVERLRNHMNEFDLHNRYSRELNVYLSGFDVSMKETFDAGGAVGLSNYLSRCAQSQVNRFGHNDWRPALLRGLSVCQEFCEGGFLTALGKR
jgi:hypothetical protein